MLKNLFFLFLFFSLAIPAQNVRELYKDAPKTKLKSDKFYNKLKNIKERDNAVLVGYKSASMILKAKFVKGIKNKKKFFKQGVLLLEKQIKRQPKNIELRFIRLSIQENTPKRLKYQKNINTDKSFIKRNLKFVKNKKDLVYFRTFITQLKSFTKEEKANLGK